MEEIWVSIYEVDLYSKFNVFKVKFKEWNINVFGSIDLIIEFLDKEVLKWDDKVGFKVFLDEEVKVRKFVIVDFLKW